MPAHDRILILGGTKEAAELATNLVNQGRKVTTSLAGRTKEPKPVSGDLRTGGFGGVNAMADWIRNNQISEIIDCTHPFAEQISLHAVRAAQLTKVPISIHKRAPWIKQKGDNWIEVNSLNEACNAIPVGARVLLALGSQHLVPFEKRDDVHFIIRMVDEPAKPLLFKSQQLILGRPSVDVEDEREMLVKNQVSHILCRNSGGEGAYAKIAAARKLNIPVIIIAMPS